LNGTIRPVYRRITDVEENDNQSLLLPERFNLGNYPNPFNPGTKIRFEIPDQARNDNVLVTLKVYDILGNEVATLVNEEKPSGRYEVEFNSHSGLPSGEVRNLVSGIYFCRLQTENYSKTIKMLYLK
jgi:hypothetical protein